MTSLPTAPTVPAPPPLHPSLPKRPTYDFAANADSIGLGAKPTAESLANLSTAAQALGGSNRDVVANRRAIRLANMSAAEVLKAELAGLSPVKPLAKPPSKIASLPSKPQPMVVQEKDETCPYALPLNAEQSFSPCVTSDILFSTTTPVCEEGVDVDVVVDTGPVPNVDVVVDADADADADADVVDADADADGDPDPDPSVQTNDSAVDYQVTDAVQEILAGAKRKFEEGPGAQDASEEDVISIEDEDDADGDGVSPSLALKVHPDGTVEQEDVVK